MNPLLRTTLPAQETMTKARTNLLLTAGFFGSLLMRLPTRESSEVETMAVDGVNLYYNPEFVRALSLEEVKTVLVHEVLHIILGHHERGVGRDHRIWNEAADYAVNILISDEGKYRLPEGALLDVKYRGMSAEEIYIKLRNGQQEKGQTQAEEGDKPNPLGEVRPKPADAPASAGEGQWRASVRTALRQDAKQGSLSKSGRKFFENLVNPETPWGELLREYMTDAAKDDTSWRHQNRRYIANNIYLPSTYSERMGDIVIAIDTSGSVDEKLLKRFLEQVRNILEEISFSSAWVVQCSTTIVKVDEYQEASEIHPEIKSGGGTRFHPVFDWIEEEGLQPNLLLYFTDLAIIPGRIPEEPSYPVIWAEGDTPSAHRSEPGYGDIIQIS